MTLLQYGNYVAMATCLYKKTAFSEELVSLGTMAKWYNEYTNICREKGKKEGIKRHVHIGIRKYLNTATCDR